MNLTLDVETIKKLLPSYGYTPQENDDVFIELAIQRTRFYVLSWCNITEIPDELIPEMIDMALAEFLYTMAVTGQLTKGGINFTKAVTSFSEGDTSIGFGNNSKTPEDTFVSYFDEMRKGRKGILEHFRRLHW